MPTESHRMEVVAEAKHRRKAIVWEVVGLVLALGAGALVLAIVVKAVVDHAAALAEAKARQAAEAKPEFASVDVQPVAAEAVRDSIRIPGLVFPRLEVKTPVEVSGRVVEKLVENGQAVKKGDVILRIDPRDYRVRMRRAESTLNLARLQHERVRNLAGQRAVSLSELDAAEAELEKASADYEDATLALERCEVKSPLDGDAADIKPEIGEWLESGAIIANIIDIGKVKVKVGISERDLFAVRSLDSCELTVDSVRGGYTFTGKKITLSLAPAENTQVYLLELEADNSEGLLRPGMFVEADVTRDVRTNSVMVTAFTVMTTPASTYEVAVVENVREEPRGADASGETPLPPEKHGVVRRVPVNLGLMQGSRVEIILAEPGKPGLHAGDLLVVNGQRNLDAGTPVLIRRVLRDIEDIDR